MRVIRVLFLAFVLLGLACTRQDDTSVTIRPEPPPAPLPEDVTKLGKPCPPAEAASSPRRFLGCGKTGRIAFVSVRGRTGLPKGAHRLWAPKAW